MHKDHTTQEKPKKDEREEVLKEIRQLENRQKILENKQRNEERKARTRRLIERGAVLEGVFPLAPDLPGVDVKAFLIALSHLPGAAELAAKLPKSGDKPFKEIAEAEGFTTSAAIVTVRTTLIKLQKYFIKRGWMEPPKEKAICTKTTPPKRNRKRTSAKKS